MSHSFHSCAVEGDTHHNGVSVNPKKKKWHILITPRTPPPSRRGSSSPGTCRARAADMERNKRTASEP
uniref:Uncharacterized protein n=1 Tax=Knipowitschia caucasica TaxID=637954 RepID=A0AAV2MT47_KNICA